MTVIGDAARRMMAFTTASCWQDNRHQRANQNEAPLYKQDTQYPQ